LPSKNADSIIYNVFVYFSLFFQVKTVKMFLFIFIFPSKDQFCITLTRLRLLMCL